MTQKKIKVSIIIPHWNGIEILSECLESIKKSSFKNYEIVVVDNNSSDGSPDWVRSHYPEVKLLENDQNYGYAGGCNRGADAARGEYYVFLNNDTIQDFPWLEHLADFLDQNPEAGVCQPKILNYFKQDIFDYAGGAGGWLDILAFPFARGRIFNTRELDRGQYDRNREIFWASGTALMIRASAFEAGGKFDETFFAHMEEIDLCWRLHLLGIQVWAVPSSVVYHKNAATLPVSRRKLYLNHRNNLLMILSNYNLPLTLYLFPLRYILEWAAAVHALVLFDFSHAAAIFQAQLWIIFHPRIIWRRRKKVQALRLINDREFLKNVYKGSIVFNYFLRRKKKSSEIIPE